VFIVTAADREGSLPSHT